MHDPRILLHPEYKLVPRYAVVVAENRGEKADFVQALNQHRPRFARPCLFYVFRVQHHVYYFFFITISLPNRLLLRLTLKLFKANESEFKYAAKDVLHYHIIKINVF